MRCRLNRRDIVRRTCTGCSTEHVAGRKRTTPWRSWRSVGASTESRLAIELAASRMQSMTATDVRDRLDDRFRLLVGARRGLERHQTLRHAVQWSYDLLDDAEKTLLDGCSVFAGGFDLAGASAVSGADDELTTLDLLDALVRKSLLVADRSSARTRFSMLETIRGFAEEQLAASGEADAARSAHARYFASREPTSCHCGTAHASARPTPGSSPNWRICAPRSDGPPTTTTSTPPLRLPSTRAFSAIGSNNHEPIAWAEELIEPAQRRPPPPAAHSSTDGCAVLCVRPDR